MQKNFLMGLTFWLKLEVKVYFLSQIDRTVFDFSCKLQVFGGLGALFGTFFG